MSKKLIQSFKQFLSINYLGGEPLLLALSGGPDSLSLFYLLLDVRKDFKIDLHIAHVNHGWRDESEEEAKSLKELAKVHKLPFHFLKLEAKDYGSKNLEDRSRTLRYEFFQKLNNTYNFHAVLLGHQRNDLEETVLKRVLEGSLLYNLYGMQKISKRFSLVLWRPLLDHTKLELLSFIKERPFKPFFDKTNEDEKFLRAKMRKEIFPTLEKSFGKKISNSCFQLSYLSSELKMYLEKKVKRFSKKVYQNRFGIFIDLASENDIEPLELKFMLSSLFKEKGFTLSREQTKDLIKHFFLSSSQKNYLTKRGELILDRKRIFTFFKTKPRFIYKENMSLKSGQYGDFYITLNDTAEGISNDWQSLWKEGSMTLLLPTRDCILKKPSLSKLFNSKSKDLSDYWTNHKVPAFLRTIFPLIHSKENHVYEMLTGKSSDGTVLLTVSIKES